MSVYAKLLLLNNISCLLNVVKQFYYTFLLKFNVVNIFMLPNFHKIIITITFSNNLRNELDLKIINSLNILDLFFWKKSEIFSLTQKYLHKSKNIVFVARSVLMHKFDIFKFFFLFFKLINPSLKKRYIFLKFKILNDGFIFFIPDISNISGISEDLKKDKISIKISIYFNKYITKQIIIFVLYYFGFKQVFSDTDL